MLMLNLNLDVFAQGKKQGFNLLNYVATQNK